MTNHPITPPPELLDKWNNLSLSTQEIFVIVAQWGADRELEACCEWLGSGGYAGTCFTLRAARRPAIEPEPQGPNETAWALAQLLDGVQRHDLPNMTGLSDSDCDRIWAARPATTGEQQ